jgi:hypothetical protein
VRADFWTQASGLWTAQLVHKVAILGFSFVVGHRLGAEGVGVMASVLALSWIGGTLAGMGLPDRALFRGAAADQSRVHRRLHGLFLGSVAVVHLGLWWAAPILAGTEELALVVFARGLVIGAGLQCASAVGLGWLRGTSNAQFEVIATGCAGAFLVGGALLGWSLGTVWALAGSCFLMGSIVGNVRLHGLIPSLPQASDGREAVRAGLPYLAFGLGAWGMGNVDILLGRLFHPPDALGALQVGTMSVRGLGLLPWVAATLMLRPLHVEWSEGGRPRPWAWMRNGAVVGVLVAVLAWVVMPFLAQGHALPVSAIERSTWVSMVFAPVLYSLVLLMPIAAQWNLRSTLKGLGMGLITQAGVGVMAMEEVEVATCVFVGGVGQLVALMWLINALRSVPEERRMMDGSASVPGVATGGLVGESTEAVELGPLQSEE